MQEMSRYDKFEETLRQLILLLAVSDVPQEDIQLIRRIGKQLLGGGQARYIGSRLSKETIRVAKMFFATKGYEI